MCLSEPGLVVDVDERGEEAIVEIRGTRRRVAVSLLTLEGTSVTRGDWVLAHAGMAVERLNVEDARSLAALLAQARGEEDES